ncbi:MAG TPA: hypothetical protein DDZ88_22170 [Verrucomicrobiales bacterium]|nr:hypothetical protein [Verrucomicrobiales bacterium]
MKTAFCTLCEGDYHHGAAALLNSLVTSGFDGVYVIGWRGLPPPWAAGLPRDESGGLTVGGVRVLLEEMRTPWSLAHVKPHFMLDILERLVPEADAVCYADPDIVMEAPWSFFESWLARGVALCEDCCFPNLSSHHYLRQCWREFARENLGLGVDAAMDRDFNSGFAGARREDMAFLRTWRDALDQMEKAGVPMAGLKPGSRFAPFFGTDQDALNIAAMTHSSLLSTLGPEGMGFSGGMTAMWHAVEPPKPWCRCFVWDLLGTGRPVPQSHRQFWRHAGGPVRSWSPVQLAWKRLDLRLAVLLSRFYHSA